MTAAAKSLTFALAALVGLSFGAYAEELAPATGFQTYNVRDFGAVADGATDDTLAVRAALNAATAAGGGTVFLPAGTYRLAPTEEGKFTFTITSSNITIAGEGADKTILSFLAWGGRDPESLMYKRGGGFVILPPRGNAVKNITFRDLRATGNARPTANAGIWQGEKAMDGWDIDHKGIGIWGKMDGLLVERCTWDSWRGEIIYSGGGIELGSFVIRDTTIYNSNASAISMTGAVTVDNCEIYDVYNGVENFSIGAHHHTSITNSMIEPSRDFQMGKFGVVYIGTRVSSLKVIGNVIKNASSGAVFLSEGAHGVEISDNSFVDCIGVYGIILSMYPTYAEERGFTDILIQNNQFKAVSKSVDSGLLFYTNRIDGLHIRGNTVDAVSGTGFRKFIDLAGVASGFIVENNFIGNGIKPLRIGNFAHRPKWINNTIVGSYALGDRVSDYGSDFNTFINLRPGWGKVQVTAIRDGVDGRKVRIPSDLIPYLYEGFEVEIRRTGSRAREFGVEVSANPEWNTLTRGYMLYEGAVIRLRLENGLFHLVNYTPPTSVESTQSERSPYYARDLYSLNFRGATKLYLEPKVEHTFNDFCGIADGADALVYYNSLTRIAQVPGVIEVAGGMDFVANTDGMLYAQRIGDSLFLTTPQCISAWNLTAFDSADLLNHASAADVWGPMATPANDGVPNIIKYHLGLEPTEFVAGNRITHVSKNPEAESTQLSYWRNRYSADTVGVVEWSVNLADWYTAGVNAAVVEQTETHQLVLAEVPAQPMNVPVFMRLRVEQTSPSMPPL